MAGVGLVERHGAAYTAVAAGRDPDDVPHELAGGDVACDRAEHYARPAAPRLPEGHLDHVVRRGVSRDARAEADRQLPAAHPGRRNRGRPGHHDRPGADVGGHRRGELGVGEPSRPRRDVADQGTALGAADGAWRADAAQVAVAVADAQQAAARADSGREVAACRVLRRRPQDDEIPAVGSRGSGRAHSAVLRAVADAGGLRAEQAVVEDALVGRGTRGRRRRPGRSFAAVGRSRLARRAAAAVEGAGRQALI
jgi:hypothetical protein